MTPIFEDRQLAALDNALFAANYAVFDPVCP